jgi:hypothetical protein
MGFLESALGKLFYWINRRIYWHQLPRLLGFLNLIALRVNLRQKNLIDTMTVLPEAPAPDSFGAGFDLRGWRTPDGSYNDREKPWMGMKGVRFGRNVGIEHTWPVEEGNLMKPSPRTISRQLLQRKGFRPATGLNLLAAAWIQYQVHDWFTHGRNDRTRMKEVPLDQNDDWPLPKMEVPATTQDPTFVVPNNERRPPTFLSQETHWWDASALYGNAERQKQLREGAVRGKLRMAPGGLLPLDEEKGGIDLTGNNNNWWIGLTVMHTLLAREHNTVCDMLAEAHPDWSDDKIFHTARLVMAALIAKIHTIEWTPTLLDTPLLHTGMRGNWWGLLGERIRKRFGRLTADDYLSGIMGSKTDHHGCPYSLTEEFVAVYRMHPLIPDEFAIRVLDTGEVKTFTLAQVSNRGAREVLSEVGIHNLVYHIGTANPGALTLQNYPLGLSDLVRQDGKGRTDLACVEIMRDRERGVPRYNKFRELLDMPRLKSFSQITADPALARKMETIYGGDIEAVDTMVGLLAEAPPPGFIFSDTAFRVFILMASRRLKSDRFFTTDFTPEIYSREGMDWVQNTTFTDILRRHFPDVTSGIAEGKSPFAPWGAPAS